MNSSHTIAESIEQVLAHPDFIEGTHWRECTYSAGQKIISKGEQNNDIFLINKGKARVLAEVELDKGKQILPGVCDLGPGDVFGELSLFDELPRSATVQVIEDCSVVQINGEELNKFLRCRPEIGYEFVTRMMKVVVGRLRKNNQRVGSLIAWGMKVHKIDDHF
ncbi:MAG: cyclic nucleotide-binding domain-containing protein [Gammaproteobacteria bacterium]|nr:cyclic nucleotide-binding domain-containing protein [Gammaproteobacteria bacterium]